MNRPGDSKVTKAEFWLKEKLRENQKKDLKKQLEAVEGSFKKIALKETF